MMRHILSAMLATVALISASTVNAAALCTGNVTQVGIWNDGRVNIFSSWRNDWTTICNLNEEFKGVPPQTCYFWYSMVSNSITEPKNIAVYYPSITQGECATMLTEASAPGPGYVKYYE